MMYHSASRERNAVDRGPSRTNTWPPAWLQGPAETDRLPNHEPQAPSPMSPAQQLDHSIILMPTERPYSSGSGPQCPRCHARDFIDVPIHGGQSARRDCARCDRFISFPVWYPDHVIPPPADVPDRTPQIARPLTTTQTTRRPSEAKGGTLTVTRQT